MAEEWDAATGVLKERGDLTPGACLTGNGVAFQKPVPHEGKRTWYGMPWLMPRRAFTEKFPVLAIFAVNQAFPWTVLLALLGCLQLNSAPCSPSKSPTVTSAHLAGCGKPWEYKTRESSWAANCWGLGEHPMAGGRTSPCSSAGSCYGPHHCQDTRLPWLLVVFGRTSSFKEEQLPQ